MKAFLLETRSAVVLAAETKIVQAMLQDAGALLERHGWTGFLVEAAGSCSKKASGGVAVLARKPLGLGKPWWRETACLEAGRVATGHVCGHSKGGITAFVVYLWPGEGLSERNRRSLDEIA